MILILYCIADKSTENLIKYLDNKKADYIALEIERDLIKANTHIMDTWDCGIISCNDIQIDFKNITSIYNRLMFIDDQNFFDYELEDVRYAQREWWAYLFYRIELCVNVINPSSCALMSSVILDFPYFYNIAKNSGFLIPEFFLSTSYDEIREKFNYNKKQNKKSLVVNSLFLPNRFVSSDNISEKAIGIIEHIAGELILVHIIGNKCYSCVVKNNERVVINLTKEEQDLCIKLKNTMQVQILQIFTKRKNNSLVLLNLSIFPNWDYNSKENIDKIYADLFFYLKAIKNDLK